MSVPVEVMETMRGAWLRYVRFIGHQLVKIANSKTHAEAVGEAKSALLELSESGLPFSDTEVEKWRQAAEGEGDVDPNS